MELDYSEEIAYTIELLQVLRLSLDNVDQRLERKLYDRFPCDFLFGHQVESFQDHPKNCVDLGVLGDIFVCLSNIHQGGEYSPPTIVTLVHRLL